MTAPMTARDELLAEVERLKRVLSEYGDEIARLESAHAGEVLRANTAETKVAALTSERDSLFEQLEAESVAYHGLRDERDELETERDQYRDATERSTMRWYHLDKGRTECVAGHDAKTRLCAEGGGPVISQVEYLQQIVEIERGLADRAEDELSRIKADADHLRDEADGKRPSTRLDQRISTTTAAHVLHHFGAGGYAPGSFTALLIELIARADPSNRAILAAAYPAYAKAVALAQGAEEGIAELTAIANGPELPAEVAS